MSDIRIPEGWTIATTYIGHTATHDDYDADWQGEENGWVDNGLSCWARTKEELPALIAEDSGSYDDQQELLAAMEAFGCDSIWKATEGVAA